MENAPCQEVDFEDRIILHPLTAAARLTARKHAERTNLNSTDDAPPIMLRQYSDVTEFTIGREEISPTLVLQVPEGLDDNECVYINTYHGSIFPDPDRKGAEFWSNAPFSPFVATSESDASDKLTANRGQSVFLSTSNTLTWIVEFTKIHRFRLVFPPDYEHPGRKQSDNEQYTPLLQYPVPDLSAATEEWRSFEGNAQKLPAPTPEFAEPARSGPFILSETIHETDSTLVTNIRQNGTIVAVRKMLRGKNIASAARTWQREHGFFKTLQHANLPHLINANALDLSFIITYVGQDLSKHRNAAGTCNLKGPAQYRIWRDIASALKYVHSKGIIHMDIKAENILLAENAGKAVLCDFGSAWCTPISSRVIYGGTPRYIPPELLRKNERSFPADIWALGIVMLYVFGQIQCPEQSGWWIRDIARETESRRKERARGEMMDWLAKVELVKDQIPLQQIYAKLLLWMLEPNPMKRIVATDLAAETAAMVESATILGKGRTQSGTKPSAITL